MKRKGLRRRTVKRPKRSKPPNYLTPSKKEKGAPFSTTVEYKYFEGHVIPEVASQLPRKQVICWHNDHMLHLSVCAVNKFWHLRGYCKRCPLFQNDEHAQDLKVLIEEWEKDDLEQLEDNDGN